MTTTKVEAPHYTQVPNIILDNMDQFSGSELKVVMAITRATLGWHRNTKVMSISYIAKATGLSNQSVITATAALLEDGIIDRFKYGESYAYRLQIQESTQKIGQGGSLKIRQAVVKKMDKRKDTLKDNVLKEKSFPEPNGSGTTATVPSTLTQKKPKTKRKVDARLQHPAIKAWSTMTEKPTYILNGAQRDMIINAVGDSSSNLENWRQAVRAWMGHGYKPTDVINQLDYWRKGKWRDGGIRATGRGNGRNDSETQGGKGKGATPEELAATREYLKQLEVWKREQAAKQAGV